MYYGIFYNTRGMNLHHMHRVIDLMTEHANRSTRDQRDWWTLEWRHDSIGVNFGRRDDWRFFKRTYPAAYRKVFQPRPVSSTVNRTEVLAGIRARLNA